ncbi:hypothetical protein FRC11_011418, partial [Ceratobasidium sp. 423]
MSHEKPLQLAWTHCHRFWRFGLQYNIKKAIEYGTRALELTPDEHPGRPSVLGGLGTFYHEKFKRMGNLEDLEKAIELQSQGLASTPDDHPDLAHQHDSLALSYTHRFWRLGELGDIQKSIENRSRALALTPDGHTKLSLRHAGLALPYKDRFRRLGELDDLEKAIEHESRALKLTLDGDPDLPYRHANLGASYADRFQRLGELGDLEKSIEHKARALELTPDDNPDLPYWHANLGVSYGDRFWHLGQLGDLEKTIEHETHALEATPNGHPDLPDRHGNLGASYSDRFELLGEFGDLEKSIEHISRALTLTPNGHPDLPIWHASLGVSYNHRFQRLGEPGDLEKVIEHDSRAVALTPDGHPDAPDRYYNQAHTYFLQHKHTGDPSHLNHALDSFRRSTRLSTGAPRKVFQNAFDWAKLASKNSSLNCIEAYYVTMDLLPQFIWFGASTNQRYQDLSTTESLAIQAAAAAILHSDPKLALEWLEHGRCVVWNQSLMLRSPLDQLHISHPDLASRLQTVSRELHDASSETLASQALSSTLIDMEQIARQRRDLAKEYQNLLAQARQCPGFEDLLQPIKVNRLVRAARNGPIVVINCHEDHCDALLVLPGQDNIKHLPLPNFTGKIAQSLCLEMDNAGRNSQPKERSVERRPLIEENLGYETVLAALWYDLVKPVLEFLGFLNEASTGDLPHITWCPTGALSFLPLHAAGDYDRPGCRVFNYAISSYTPTLAALLTSTPSSLNRSSQVLAIGQANTLGHTPLPGTTKELEYLEANLKNIAEYSQLKGDQATTAAVLDAMERHDWVHLACHAHQNVNDPTKSGHFLHDGILDLVAINRRSFKNKGLAFLSACQTATGDRTLPDEAIHLASGMLMAGYPSVVATM